LIELGKQEKTATEERLPCEFKDFTTKRLLNWRIARSPIYKGGESGVSGRRATLKGGWSWAWVFKEHSLRKDAREKIATYWKKDPLLWEKIQ